MMGVLLILLNVFFLILLNSRSGLTFSCKDESNQDVDWFLNYKLPKIKGKGLNFEDGTSYASILPDSPNSWNQSLYSITSKSSMLAQTLQPFFNNQNLASYLFYNDEVPLGYNGTSIGHLKGILVFNGKSGFWIVHSIPKFSGIDSFVYPETALEYGQSIFCVSFKTSTLNEICTQLLYCHPYVYERRLTDDVRPFLDKTARIIFQRDYKFKPAAPYVRTTVLKSGKGDLFLHFAKNRRYINDIYGSLMAPKLRVPLYTETWRRGSGSYLPPFCNGNFTVLDVTGITMGQGITFQSSSDHSKWAVSVSRPQWLCVGDMNRMLSQEKRGGGSLCFQSASVVDAYRSLISSSDHCAH